MNTNQENEKAYAESVDKVEKNGTDGTYSKAGREETGAMPNDPAANAKKTSPEEDAGEKEDTRFQPAVRTDSILNAIG